MQIPDLKCKFPINNLDVATGHFEPCELEQGNIYLHTSN